MKVIVNNIALNYTDEGRGPAMVFLHGWADQLHTFDQLTGALGGHWRLIKLDLPGFGGSEAPPETWSLDNYVELVQAFVDKLGIEVDTMVCHSLGGRIALKGVGTGRLRPRRIILIASAGIAKSRSLRNQAYKAVAKIGKVVTAVPPLSLARGRLRRRLYDRAGSDYLNAGTLQATFLNLIAEDLQTAAAHITVPTLLIWGANDTATPLTDGRRLHHLIPGSRLEIIAGASHFVHQEQPAAVAQLIQEFAS